MMEIIPPGKPTSGVSDEEKIHTLYVVNAKHPPSPIQEAKCRIVVTDKVSWAEPIMPLRGALRKQKRFMIGAMAFYLRQQAEKKKLILLMSAAKAGPRQWSLATECMRQIEHHRMTGEIK